MVDKLSEKYPFASNYAYVLNCPTVAVDPDGKRVYFIGGAGNDQDGWDYINRWARAFASNGINDFYSVNASRGSVVSSPENSTIQIYRFVFNFFRAENILKR